VPLLQKHLLLLLYKIVQQRKLRNKNDSTKHTTVYSSILTSTDFCHHYTVH